MTNAPAVSVIIPLYNAEKFIGACLESLLAQTFQNFEVIIVDDCSTDSGRAVAETYLEKFSGRLKLSGMEKNSGKPSLPRNKGLFLSRGEYIFFMDNDDMLTKTALAQLHALAEDFAADVVYCEKNYTVDAENNLRLTSFQGRKIFVDRPTFEPDALPERVNRILQNFFWVPPWSKLVRRDLLLEHEIFFPDIIRDDDVWTWNLLFHAKNFLRVPDAVYIWRNVEDSITRSEKTPAQKINFWLNPVVLGVQNFDAVMERVEFFKKNPRHRYAMLNFFIEISFSAILKSSFELQPFEIFEAIREKFGDALGQHDVLIPLLCTVLNTQQKNFAINNQKFQHFAGQAQRRIAELEAEKFGK